MRRFVIAAVAIAVLAAGTLVIGRTAPVDDEQAASKAHAAFVAGLRKGDQKAIGALLDRRFIWTDAEGRTFTRREALKALSALATANSDDDVRTRFYGRMLMVRGEHDQTRFLRVFVKRRHGWKAFALLETPVAAGAAAAQIEAATAAAGDCDNPCRSVPYAPKTQLDNDVLAAWQKTKLLEWTPDAAEWAKFIADEFQIIDDTSVRNKAQRVDSLMRQQDAGTGTPGDPVTSLRIYGFGSNSALMTSQHTPYRGGKSYSNVGIWVLRDGRWQLALSQQVTIQVPASPSAVVSKQ
jgi:hypothetical protein